MWKREGQGIILVLSVNRPAKLVWVIGLTSIAGHLLLLAPEEDAFWFFASKMDAPLRTHFSTNTIQIEVYASLFSRALEAIDRCTWNCR